jgi:hypothetical protein
VTVDLTLRKEIVHLSLSNPWLPLLASKKDPQMPEEVKAIMCEVDRLRVQLTKEPVRFECKTSGSPTK